MTRDLQETLARFEAASNPTISYRGLDWPEFESFLTACIALEKKTEHLILPKQVEDTLKILRYIRRKLRTIPLHPATEILGLKQFVNTEVSTGVDEIAELLKTCQEAARGLLEADHHPGADFLRDRVEQIRASQPNSLIHAVVSRDSKAEMQEVSDLLGLQLSVTDLTGAKRVDVGEACFIFGSPESLHGLGLHWMEQTEAERSVAWLFNAPIAREVCVVSWPGNRAFKVDNYALFPGSSLKITSSTGREVFPIQSSAEFVRRLAEAAPLPTNHGVPDNELVEARALQLAGGLWVYFGTKGTGPQPDRITETDFELTVEDVSSLNHLAEGDRLVIRDGDASRRFLEAEADKWLREKYGKDEPEACKAVRDRFRAGVLSLEENWHKVQHTVNLGLSTDEIKYRFRLAHDRTHIAPESEAVYRVLSKAFSGEPTSEDWDRIRHLRSAMKRAGRIARQEMEQRITQDDSWNDIVDIPDAATVNMGDLGSLVISRILQILPDPVHVPISRLGQLQKGKS